MIPFGKESYLRTRVFTQNPENVMSASYFLHNIFKKIKYMQTIANNMCANLFVNQELAKDCYKRLSAWIGRY
jgi:hypothetical protein